MDSGSFSHCLHHCGIGDFYFSYHFFTKLSEMTDAYKAMNPQHFGSDPADIRIVDSNPGSLFG